MKKQQKWELLKFAYDTYPKGTRYKNLGCNDLTSESSGVFHIDNDYGIRDSKTFCFVMGTENKWAEIVTEKPKSILDGKVAIEVKNDREFKLLMEHYESKEWKGYPGSYLSDHQWRFYVQPDNDGFENIFTYHDGVKRLSRGISSNFCPIKLGYKIISFEEFAAEIGIELPVFAIKSIDGVDLFFGDKIHRSWWDNFNNKWRYDNCTLSNDRNAVITGVDQAKAFSTKEAAEAWIFEANKPIKIPIYNKTTIVGNVNIDGFWPINLISYKYGIPTEMIHDIYNASKKLNS